MTAKLSAYVRRRWLLVVTFNQCRLDTRDLNCAFLALIESLKTHVQRTVDSPQRVKKLDVDDLLT